MRETAGKAAAEAAEVSKRSQPSGVSKRSHPCSGGAAEAAEAAEVATEAAAVPCPIKVATTVVGAAAAGTAAGADDQGLTLVHVRAQLEQLQATFMT